jgi:hypothetical protein
MEKENPSILFRSPKSKGETRCYKLRLFDGQIEHPNQEFFFQFCDVAT